MIITQSIRTLAIPGRQTFAPRHVLLARPDPTAKPAFDTMHISLPRVAFGEAPNFGEPASQVRYSLPRVNAHLEQQSEKLSSTRAAALQKLMMQASVSVACVLGAALVGSYAAFAMAALVTGVMLKFCRHAQHEVREALRAKQTAQALKLLVDADTALRHSRTIETRDRAREALFEANTIVCVAGSRDMRLDNPIFQFAERLNDTFENVF